MSMNNTQEKKKEESIILQIEKVYMSDAVVSIPATNACFFFSSEN